MQLSQFFAKILHAGRGAIDMKRIKDRLRGGAEANFFFWNMVMLHIMLEQTTHAATW